MRNPYLYQLEITLTDSEGEVTEVVPYKIGFRDFILDPTDRVMKLNGERLVICGVNRMSGMQLPDGVFPWKT